MRQCHDQYHEGGIAAVEAEMQHCTHLSGKMPAPLHVLKVGVAPHQIRLQKGLPKQACTQKRRELHACSRGSTGLTRAAQATLNT